MQANDLCLQYGNTRAGRKRKMVRIRRGRAAVTGSSSAQVTVHQNGKARAFGAGSQKTSCQQVFCSLAKQTKQ